ncbi:MAG: UDP-N-acetylmuramate dehydrogenase [Candidatus Margulisiibacteriota bacterium]
MIVRHEVPISTLTTFKNQGTVGTLTLLESPDDLAAFFPCKTPFFVLGKGSNTLINPEGPIQSFVQLSHRFIAPSVEGHRLTVSAGTTVNMLMNLAVQHGLSGLEFSAGVPASVGGMVAMNFGCWSSEVADVLLRAWVLDPNTGKTEWLSKTQLAFGYRKSIMSTSDRIVLAAEFDLSPDSPKAIEGRILANIHTRLSKQPLRAKTFGSCFKNPDGHFAGALIEAANLKNFRIGDAAVSEKHANFMVNLGNSNFSDIESLIRTLQARVLSHANIQLEPEVKLVT